MAVAVLMGIQARDAMIQLRYKKNKLESFYIIQDRVENQMISRLKLKTFKQ